MWSSMAEQLYNILGLNTSTVNKGFHIIFSTYMYSLSKCKICYTESFREEMYENMENTSHKKVERGIA